MNYYFIAGEASGDLHGANCMRGILKLDPHARFGFTGGAKMEEVTGVKADIDIRDMAFMGFVDVLKNIGTIRKNFKKVKECILAFRPDVLVLVDYPGFNLRMAKWAHEQGIRVDYYISPTVWAWKEGRVEQIRAYTHKLFVILPFEEVFYQKHNLKVHFVGHPLIDAIEQQKPLLKNRETFVRDNALSGRPIVAVLPGSRVQEIERMLDIMLEVKKDFPDHDFVVAGAGHLDKRHYEPLLRHRIPVVFDQTYELMSYAEAGIIKSGTSTLESALFRLPQVVCYKAGALSFAIGKRLVKIDYISLVNLIMKKPVVKELIQEEMRADTISAELRRLIDDKTYRANMISEYETLSQMLGGGGASERLAESVVADARQKTK